MIFVYNIHFSLRIYRAIPIYFIIIRYTNLIHLRWGFGVLGHSKINQDPDLQVAGSHRTQRSQQEVWRVSNINEDLVYDDGEESSQEDDDKQQK
jgi:hypothetical protein